MGIIVICEQSELSSIIWLLLILLSVVVAAYTGKMRETLDASFESAKGAVGLAIYLPYYVLREKEHSLP